MYLGIFDECFLPAEMTTKFNKDMYAKMRSKKDEPLSNLGKKVVRVTGQGPTPTPLSTIPPIPLDMTRTASPTTSIEEIVTPGSKRQRVAGKGKEKKKADVCSSTIWDDERLALDRAHEVVTPADLRALSDMSLNDVASRYVHKLVQVRSSSTFSLFICVYTYILLFIYLFFFTDDL